MKNGRDMQAKKTRNGDVDDEWDESGGARGEEYEGIGMAGVA